MLLTLSGLWCWGTWPNFLAVTNASWSLTYLWMAIAGTLTMTLCAWTTSEGSVWPDEKAAVLSAVAGGLCTTGLMLVCAALERAGLAAAVPVSSGVEMVVGTLALYVVERGPNPMWLAAGVACAACAVACNATAKLQADDAKKTLPKSASELEPLLDERPVVLGGLVRAVAAGLCFATWPVLETVVVRRASVQQFVVPFAVGFASVTAFVLPAADDERRRPFSVALFGTCAGLLWGLGTFSTLFAATDLGLAVALAIPRCSPLLTTAFGLLLWDEFPLDRIPSSAKTLLVLNVLFYVAAILAFYISAVA